MTANSEEMIRTLEAIGEDGLWDAAAAKQVAAGLRHGHELVRIEAIETAEACQIVAMLPRVRRLLADPSPLVRAAAATAIGAMGTVRDRGRLAQRFTTERSTLARVGLAAGMWLLGEPRGLDALLHLLSSGQYRVRSAVANTLAFYEERVQDRAHVLTSLRQALAAEDTVAARDALQRAITTLQKRRRTASR
jgi:HEAT repeat protein